MGQNQFVAGLTWDEVERRLASTPTAILPVGAAAKEHGWHLPMNTDEIQANWLAARLGEYGDSLIWPALTYGFYPAFRDFPGSISLSEPVFVALIREVIGEILRWPVSRLIVLNTGISTIRPVETAIASQAWPQPVLHLKVHEGPSYRAAAAALREQDHGSHADELETSRMLAIAPEAVGMARAVASPPGPIAGPLTRTNAPSGSYGRPELATIAKGERLNAAMLEDFRDVYD